MPRAYPRSRGGTALPAQAGNAGKGLSPLARGNPVCARNERLAPGPIPARAGEPDELAAAECARRAYPRSRGGTTPLGRHNAAARGLSPLARGNQRLLEHALSQRGPIPARAGEPASISSALAGSGAYPRSRGGTDSTNAQRAFLCGLSPLARGNRAVTRGTVSDVGPIPARAGEP